MEENFGSYDVKFRPRTYSGPLNQPIRAIEYEAITLCKHLCALGHIVRIPYCQRLAFNDTVFNFPIMICKSIDIANSVIHAVFDFIKIWYCSHDDRIISFGIKANYADYAVKYSFVGHVYDFFSLSQNFDFSIPTESEKIVDWATDMRKYLDKYNISYLHPTLGTMLSSDNAIIYKRVFLDTPLAPITVDDDGCTSDILVLPEAAQEISENNITATVALNIKKSICCKCRRRYSQCDCIKFLDPQCTDELVEFDLVGEFWTNRMA